MQPINTSYDFRKTYFRNFYQNRISGLVKGANFGRLAKLIHSKVAPIDTTHDGQVWNKDTEAWEQSTEADYMGAVIMYESFLEYAKPTSDSAYNEFEATFSAAILWFEAEGLNLADPYDLVAYRVARTTTTVDLTTMKHYTPNTFEAITETIFQTEFVKITKRTGPRTMDSYGFRFDGKSIPLTDTNNIYGSEFDYVDGKCIFYPNTNLEMPYTNITADDTLWDLTGDTAIIGRQASGKYACDLFDSTDSSVVSHRSYEIPMHYQFEEKPVLPSPATIKEIPKAVRDTLSFIMYLKKGEFGQGFRNRYSAEPIFSGIYVTPTIALYYDIKDLYEYALGV